jgi:hypothetical protein
MKGNLSEPGHLLLFADWNGHNPCPAGIKVEFCPGSFKGSITVKGNLKETFSLPFMR